MVSDKLRWFTQAPFYLGVLHVIHTHERLGKNPDASDSVKSILIHQDLAAINAAFRLAGIRDPFAAMAALKGLEAVDAFDAGIGSLVEKIIAMNLP